MPQPYMICPATGSDQADEWIRLGVEAHVANQLPVAQGRYQQALRLDPRSAVATQNLAIVYAQSNLLNDALLTIERASIFDNTNSNVYLNWALIALESGRTEVALEAAAKSLEINPTDLNSMLGLAMVSTSAGMPERSIELYNQILEAEPKHITATPNSCFVLTLTDATPDVLLKQRQLWYTYHAHKGKKPSQPFTNPLTTDRPLRVGYVGGDFKSHSAAFIFGGVVLHHTDKVQSYAYSSLPVNPELDHRSKQYLKVIGENWRDISQSMDEDVEKLIHQDQIDILVDLAGHTGGGRLPLFTRKAAPVQVTAWGFAHGTGCPEIDYFFADPIAIPQDERQYYLEQIYDLPCIVTLEPPSEYNLKGISHAPYRRNGYITFGAYCRYEKMNDDCVRTYAEILRRVPESKIEFKDAAYSKPYSIKRILNLMPDIDPSRLLFSLQTNHADHLLAYQQADLILDPFPHSGGAAALEQLYMGVPIVTLYGKQAAGRTTSSILNVLGRENWVAKNKEEYVDLAVNFAENTKYLADQRKVLRDDLMKSPITVGYVDKVEAAYLDMWSKYVSEHT
jgi:protein O-GlcNAc transferase